MAEKTFNVSLRQRAWYGDTTMEISLPATWDVTVCHMPGSHAKAIARQEMEAAFANPIGAPKISELARGKRQVAIIFDDLSRPTRAAELVPLILREMQEAGIPDQSIRFVAASGAHGAMKLVDFEKKLGKGIAQRFPVFNHNPYENCTYLGDTSRGTPVHINSEVTTCDLKIAIGCIVPHPTAGFGGGAKIMIGLSHVDTIFANHHHTGGRGAPTPENPLGKLHTSLGFGKVEGNVLRADLEEMARMASLDCIVNVVVNGKRDSMGVFVGDVVAAHREGVKMGREVYATESERGFDILVFNAYSKANEAAVALQDTPKLLREEGGDVVLICDTPEGQICHYTARSFGKNLGGRLWGPRETLPPRVRNMITVGSGIDVAGLDMMGPVDGIARVRRWTQALDILRHDHGHGTRVGIIPDATIQYFPEPVPQTE